MVFEKFKIIYFLANLNQISTKLGIFTEFRRYGESHSEPLVFIVFNSQIVTLIGNCANHLRLFMFLELHLFIFAFGKTDF